MHFEILIKLVHYRANYCVAISNFQHLKDTNLSFMHSSQQPVLDAHNVSHDKQLLFEHESAFTRAA